MRKRSIGRVSPGSDPQQQLHDLVNALHVMRDALVQAALVLRDVQFEHDCARRDAATGSANELMERARRPDQSRPGITGGKK